MCGILVISSYLPNLDPTPLFNYVWSIYKLFVVIFCFNDYIFTFRIF